MRQPCLFAILFISLAGVVGASNRYRKAVRIPDIPGYKTLKCDFHIHTVFSDGSVWPDIRSEEAWREGLNAIAITDHIEYQPHQEDLPTNHDRSFEIAKPHGDRLHILVIKGSEITKSMPPGHLNAIFLEDVAAVEREDWRDAVKAAIDQGALSSGIIRDGKGSSRTGLRAGIRSIRNWSRQECSTESKWSMSGSTIPRLTAGAWSRG